MRRSGTMISIALAAAALAACRAPKPLAPGDFVVAPHYAILFRPFHVWTYHVASSAAVPDPAEPAGDPDEGNSVVVHCRTDRVHPFKGGVTSHISCNLPQAIVEDTGTYPLEGVWMANATGLWHVHAGMAPSLDNATLVIRARPSEGRVDPDELTGDDEFVEVAKDNDAWCTTHHEHSDEQTAYTMCFAAEGVRSGRYGWKSGAVHETRFELAR